MRKFTLLFCFLVPAFHAFSQSLPLPFFDDFARYNNRLDTTKWLPSKGIYVNDRFSSNPVSKNVATFNGMDANGKLNTSTINGPVDTLVSRPVNLSPFAPADSVYLSFYMQIEAFDFYPDASTSKPCYFSIELKKSNGTWQQVLNILPPAPSNRWAGFRKFTVPVSNTDFFTSNFQFRFRTYGERIASDDTWTIDYVSLAPNQRKAVNTSVDVSASQPLTSILKRYTAMPVHQLNANPAVELNPAFSTILNNLSPSIRSFDWWATLQFNANPPLNIISSQTEQIGALTTNTVTLSAPLNVSAFNNLSGDQEIKTSIYFTNFEPTTETKYNDTIVSLVKLQDYYAYDDGSPETVLGIQPGYAGSVAQKYSVQQADVVRNISFYVPKLNNAKDVIVTFKIWNEDPATGNPATNSVFSNSFKVPDVTQLDNWFSIPVNPGVPVSGNFYVGWSIAANPKAFSLGLDLNDAITGLTKQYIPVTGSNWIPGNRGRLMLRPHMSNYAVGTPEERSAVAFEFFPNPATDLVTLKGNFETVTLLDASGKKIMEKAATGNETKLQTLGLKPGFYFLQIQSKAAVHTKKLIIRN